MDVKDLKNLEDDNKYRVIKLQEETKEDAKKSAIVESFSKELDHLFLNTKKFIHETKDSEKAQQAYEKVKVESSTLYERTKQALLDFKEDDRVQDVWEKITRGFDCFITAISENETVQNVGEAVNDFVKSEPVQDGLKTAKKVTLDVADRAHEGLKHILGSSESDGKE